MVDQVESLVAVAADSIGHDQAQLSAVDGELLTGAFAGGGAGASTKVLDLGGLLAAAFVARKRARPAAAGREVAPGPDIAPKARGDALVTFEVAGQEFALDLGSVREIVSAPDAVTELPRAEPLVLGLMAFREQLLPLLSLRGLLGFAPAAADARDKVIVAAIGGNLVGLVADRARAVVIADPALVDPVPTVLAARLGGEARVKSIYRGEEGKRLISILAPDQLFRADVMQRLTATGRAAAGAPDRTDDEMDEQKFLVFRLADDEFGLPVDAVDEVARVPDQITRIPKAPKFLEGVVNLRGSVLPVVDQRRRFDMPAAPTDGNRRLIVVRTERHRAGLIVDSVSEVLRTNAEAIEPPPHLTGDITRLVRGVVNLHDAGRLVLLLDPAELLTRSERGLLDAFAAREPAAS